MDNFIILLCTVAAVCACLATGGFVVDNLLSLDEEPQPVPTPHPLDDVQIITIKSKVLYIKIGDDDVG